MSNTHDVIVIGAGSGGLNIASFCNRIGLKVLLIDKSDAHIGGDCLNTGCVPSKALLHVADIVAHAKESERFGLTVQGKPDIRKALAYVREKQNVIRAHENAEHFRMRGMDVVLGLAKFSGRNSVVVNGVTYRARKIVLCTGSRPRMLRLPGAEHVPTYTSENIFTLESLPASMVFIGGGPISIELSQACARLGVHVTVIHSGTEILEREHSRTRALIRTTLERDRVTFVLGGKPVRYENGSVVVAQENGETRVPAEALFIGIGREFPLDSLGLVEAEIAIDKKAQKILVNDYLQTSNPAVYVVGDIAGNYQFTHAAEVHASVVAYNLCSPFRKKLDLSHMAWVTYTTPEVATFGASEASLKNTGTRYRCTELSLDEDDRAIVDESSGFLQLITDLQGRVLGGTVVAPRAGEIVGELILAEYKKLTVADLFNRVSPYPTSSRIIRKVAGSIRAESLTPLVQKMLRALFRIF